MCVALKLQKLPVTFRRSKKERGEILSLFFVLFYIFWPVACGSGDRNLDYLYTLHNSKSNSLCNLPSCIFPQSMIRCLCQEGKRTTSTPIGTLIRWGMNWSVPVIDKT